MRYKCEPGFTVVGRKSILCQADGTWTRSELPTCIPVQCKVMIMFRHCLHSLLQVPNSPVNGKVTFTAVAYKVIIGSSSL